MASTDLVAEANRPIFIGDVESNRPNSESINLKLAGGLNFALNRLKLKENFTMPGFFNPNSFDDGYGGIRYVENTADITSYYLSVFKSGSGGTTSFNVAVYNSSGALINQLFGSGGNALTLSGGNGTRVLIGKNGVDTVTPSNVTINTAGHSVQTGTLNLTQIPAGSMLVPYIVSAAGDAYNLNFGLTRREI